MQTKLYPIRNKRGELFCLAEPAADGNGYVLRSKTCEIDFLDFQKQVFMSGENHLRNETMNSENRKKKE